MPPFLTFYYLCHINPQKIKELLSYFYHPDHLGSSSWITDGTGQAIQHLHYLPFGEDWVDQRNSSWNAPYTFSGKEKDVETGYGYFGARYYDSGLSIWLSVDPMSDKYPSMSPYNYCANNPVMLVDPDGREVEYNLLIDKIIVGIWRKFDASFDRRIVDLENSEETYVFKFNLKKDEFTTDGNKLFINYTAKSGKKQGNNLFSNIEHETEHAIQFEYGRIGFSRDGTPDASGNFTPNLNWKPENYDINDEVEAFSYAWEFGFKFSDNNARSDWTAGNTEDKINMLRGSYNLPTERLVNQNSKKIKNDFYFQMPYRNRNY